MNIVLKNKKEKLFIILLENNKKYNSCEKRDNDNHSQKKIEIDNHSLTLKLNNIYLKLSYSLWRHKTIAVKNVD